VPQVPQASTASSAVVQGGGIVAVQPSESASVQAQSFAISTNTESRPKNKTTLLMMVALVALFGAIGVALVVAIMSTRAASLQTLSVVTGGLKVPAALSLQVQRNVQVNGKSEATKKVAGGSPP
jgi:hypothetical protein